MKDDLYFEGLAQDLAKGQLTRRQLLALMAMAGGGLLAGCTVNPVTGQSQFTLMSPSEEIAIDKENAPHQLSSDYGISRDARLRDYLAEVGREVGAQSHRPNMPYTYNPLNANYVNAYAFPGGTIGVTRGIMLTMQSEDELAALIGHEVAHVSARHTASRMSKQTLAGLAMAGAGILIASKMDSEKAALAMGLGSLAAGALLARYSRGDEREADTLGMQYMVKANHSPQGMIDLMDMLRSESKHQPSLIEQMFSSHPMSDERYADMRANAEQHYAGDLARKVKRERYMDNTATLRKLKPAIEKQQAAETALVAKRYADGEKLLAESLKQAPNDYTGLVLMAKAKMVQERFADARPFLDKAIKVYPEEAQAQHLRGVVDLKLGDASSALEHFMAYENQLPGNPRTQFFIGVSHEALAQPGAAQLAYQRYLDSGVSGPSADYARRRIG